MTTSTTSGRYPSIYLSIYVPWTAARVICAELKLTRFTLLLMCDDGDKLCLSLLIGGGLPGYTCLVWENII